MTLALVTALWRRRQVARLFLDHYRGVARYLDQYHGIHLNLVAAVSRTTDRRLARRYGWDTVFAPNSPLSNKFNAAVARARGADAVIITGCDDLTTPRTFLHLATLLEDGAQYVVPNGLCMYDLPTRRLMYLGSHQTGTFRTLRADLLDRLDWAPYVPGDDSGIDHSMTRLVAPHVGGMFTVAGPRRLLNTNPDHDTTYGATGYTIPAGDCLLVDVKDEGSMWGYDRWARYGHARALPLDTLTRLGVTGARLVKMEPTIRERIVGTWRRAKYFRHHNRPTWPPQEPGKHTGPSTVTEDSDVALNP